MPTARLIATCAGATVPFEVADRPVSLGRSSRADVTLADPIISRIHCELAFESSALFVKDLASQNGTLLDGDATPRFELVPGKSFRIGNTYVRLESVDATASKPEPAQDPLVGTVLGGYRIIAPIGRGGYATVYRAEQERLHREVALKVLLIPGNAGEREAGGSDAAKEQVEAFLREGRAAAALNHPALVHVHDVGEAEGRHFLSMELVPGGNLAQRIKTQGPFDWEEAVPVLRDLAEALQCAHEHELVHRDVKPANILLTASGRAKLADLGLASENKRAGTAAFMAPEQILREDIDARTDLYSLGCTVFAMLTGRAPFAGLKGKELLLAHVKTDPGRLSGHGVEIPPPLEDLVVDLLAKDPADRPQSAAAVLAALDEIEAFVEQDASQQPARSRRIRVRRSRTRSGSNSNAAVLGVVLLVAVIGLVALAIWWRSHS